MCFGASSLSCLLGKQTLNDIKGLIYDEENTNGTKMNYDYIIMTLFIKFDTNNIIYTHREYSEKKKN